MSHGACDGLATSLAIHAAGPGSTRVFAPKIAAEYPEKLQARRADDAAYEAQRQQALQEAAARKAQAPGSYPAQ